MSGIADYVNTIINNLVNYEVASAPRLDIIVCQSS